MKKRLFPKVLLTLLILGILSVVYSFVEPYWIQVKQYDEISRDVPPGFKGTKIVFLSDIHHSNLFSRQRVKDVVDRVNKLQPDIILLGGDYTNGVEYVEPCFRELKNLKASIGKYAVLGNHDYRANLPEVKKRSKEAGFELLNNRAVWIYKGKERIKIGGVGDLWYDTQDLSPTINDVTEKDYVILLSHNPDYVESIKSNKIDLVLSGHTHGGQLSLFGLWSPLIPSSYGDKFRTGLVNTAYTKVLASNGLGMTGFLPMRFWARPQINVIVL